MDILVNVANQKLKIATNLKSLVAGTQEFVRFVFNTSGDWDDLLTFAQFTQNGISYNQYLDDDNSAYLPSEIGVGTCTLMLYGSNENTIATTNFLTLTIDENILVSDAQSTEISQSLYTQLVTRVNTLLTWNEQNTADLIAVDADLQKQINTKANASDLTTEIARAKAAEVANSNAITTKANQSEVDELSIKVTQLENNEVIADLINDAVATTLTDYLDSGVLANMTISDSSITRAKVDSAFEATLVKADEAMQPSVYDPQGLKVDVFSYAQGRADIVQNNLNTVKTEIQDAYKLTDTLAYTSLGDAVRGAVTLSRNYAQALLADYKAFTVTIVDELPVVGDSMTFYLVPNASGDGYDKYWWITDATTNVSKWDCFGSATTLVVDELPESGSEDIDYIYHTNGTYLYYKWIDDTWQIVGGSTAYVGSTLPAMGNSYTDYYILNTSGVYVHYRWITNAFRPIGSDTYTKDEVDSIVATINQTITGVNTKASNNAANIEANTTNINLLSNALTNLTQTVNNLDVEGVTYYATYGTAEINGTETENVYTLYEVDNGEETIISQFVISGGGGGGSQQTTTLTVERITTSPLVVTTTDTVNLVYTYSSVDSDNEDVDGTYTWKLGGTVIATGACVRGTNTFNATEYCSIGTQKFTLVITDEGGSTVVKSWTVQKVDVRLESAFNDRTTYAAGSSVNFTYTPYGSVSKTVYLLLDGAELATVTTTASGTLQSYSIPAQTHGAHLLECYMTATINGSTVETEHIYKDIIWYDSASTIPVIGCIYRCLPVSSNATYDSDTDYYYINDGLYVLYEGSSSGWTSRPQLYYRAVKANQYDSTSIEYVVYNPSTGTPTVTQKIDDVASALTMDTYYDTLTYKTADTGVHTITLTCGATSVGIIMDIQELDINVVPITANLAFDFNPAGYTNSSANRLWVDDNNSAIGLSVSSNFDWSNGGYQLDSDGNRYFCVKAGTTATFSYKLFGINPYTTGAHFKLMFKTENIRDIDTTWMSCVADSVGLEMKAHQANFKTSAETLEAPYSEGDLIEFEYNIQTLDTEDANANSLVMIYEDGVAYRPLIYDSTHRLYQYAPVNIVFGSADCDVHIYRMKAYTASLTDTNTISNFIADAPDSETMIARYNRNQIYNDNNVLTPDSLAAACPNLKIIKIDCPKFTNNKSETITNTTIQCIHTGGDPILDNWTARNCSHSGQGTTSNEYGVAGRNLDLKMNLDNTIIVLGDGTTYSDGSGKISLTRTSVPNNYFNVKVNIASSDNCNNALLANRFDRYLPYDTPAKLRNPNTKTTMEFVNCAIFVRENDSDLSTHREFNDTNWHFYAIGNIGDSKKTDKTRANDPNDTKEWCNEILDNTLSNSIFNTGVVNLIVESTPTTGDLFTDYYLENSDGTYTLKRYLNNAWVTVDNTVSEIQNGAVAVVSPLPTTGIINVEYYVENDSGYIMYTWTGSAWSSGAARTEITNNHMANSISPLQFVAGNAKYDSLYAAESDEKFGTNTFEFRYEHKSVTSAQHLANMQIWRDMYTWVVTSTDDEFVDGLENWFIKDAAIYYYLFTERYTMTDNRAKNSFWHWSKVYISETEAAGDYADVKDYYTIDNAAAAINNGYRFDFWNYDNDTGLGINNSGELKMPYGKEDIDYQVDNVPSSGYIFNGAESVFFRRIRLLMHDDLVSMYQDRESAGAWTSTTFISEFDNWQDEFPEELWRLDIERKYYRPYYGTAVDNSIPKSSSRFLSTMMNGRKKYHRRQFERDQAVYIGSKYLASAIRADQIMFRCNTPQSAVVTPDYTLEIIPYSDMYLSVMFGNTTPYQVRAKAGETYSIECPLQTMDDTAILIYAASRIQALNDLSACYIHDNDFSNATKLQTLVIGNTTTGYDNSFLTTLTLGNNALLTNLDVRNCSNLTGSLNLSYCANLQTLRAEGTTITGVIFANNGKVSTVYLPNTVSSLTMRNLGNLATLNASLDNLEALVLENGILDSLSLVQETCDTLQTLRLTGINWTLATTSLLNSILKMSSTYLSGSVYVSGQIRNQEILNYESAWSDLTVTYDSENLVTQYLATYVNSDGTTLYTCYVDRGSTPPDPITLGYINTPTKDSTAQYSFAFSGWDDITSVMLAARKITAEYTSTARTYTVNWYSRAGLLLETTTAAYGSEVNYSGDTPTNTSEESVYIYNVFAGWDKSTGYITGDTDVYAVWERVSLPTSGTELEDMSCGQVFAVCSAGLASSYFTDKDHIDIQLGSDFTFSNVESQTILQNRYFDGTEYYDTNIKLFDVDSPSFTIAIDYEFLASNLSGDTLVACYDEDGNEGFRLRYSGSSSDVLWGDKSLNVGYGSNRNIVVLRHVQGSNSLFVYGFNNSNETYDLSLTSSELIRTRETSSENVLTFGALRFTGDGGHDYYGTGWIHWCKIWYADLGAVAAQQLASYPHETLRMEFCGANRYRISGQTSVRANGSFIANNPLTLLRRMNAANTNVGGWDECEMRTFLATRIYAALPCNWRSCLKQVKISASAGNQSNEIVISDDKIYLPANREVGGMTSEPYASEGSAISFFTSNASGLKFSGVIIEDNAQVISFASDPTASASYAVKEGDVWINTSNSSVGYVYMSATTVAKHSKISYRLLSSSDNIAASDGGVWVRAYYWWERSPYASGTAHFMNVGITGNPNYIYDASFAYGVVPCFSI